MHRIRRSLCFIIWTFAFAYILALSNGAAFAGNRLVITSDAFPQGGAIPALYTCTASDISPPLRWHGIPGDAKALALLVADPDAPSGTFIHWLIYNLPADTPGLPEDVTKSETAVGGEQGENGFGKIGYGGPCPPPGPAHHYHFRLYALDRRLRLEPRASADKLESAMKGHILETADLVGIYGR